MFAVTILGNNSALPAFNRFPTAQVVNVNGQLFLIDCGEGTQTQLSKYKIRKSKINQIFISHLHGDHYFGLIGLITSLSLFGRIEPITIYSPKPLKQIIDLQLEASGTVLNFELVFVSIESAGLIFYNKNVEVYAFEVKHRIPCFGFLFKEKKNLRKIILEQAIAYNVPSHFYEELKNGKDYINAKGTIIPNYEVTAPAQRPLVYAFSADTIYDEALIEVVKEVDLLYHETTFLQEDELKATQRFHSTTLQAGTIAKKAKVEKLIIGHFSSRYEHLDKFLEETKTVFTNTELALEGTTYILKHKN